VPACSSRLRLFSGQEILLPSFSRWRLIHPYGPTQHLDSRVICFTVLLVCVSLHQCMLQYRFRRCHKSSSSTLRDIAGKQRTQICYFCS
jgi:hypothetical protein